MSIIYKKYDVPVLQEQNPVMFNGTLRYRWCYSRPDGGIREKQILIPCREVRMRTLL